MIVVEEYNANKAYVCDGNQKNCWNMMCSDSDELTILLLVGTK